MRLYPSLLRGVLRLCAGRAPVTWFMALTRAAWAGPVSLLPVFGLVLALVLASFAGMVRTTVAHGEAAASWRVSGADAVVASGSVNSGFTPGDQRAIAAVRGVTHATGIRVMTWAPPTGSPVGIAAVNPASYAAFAAATPWPRFPARRLASRAGPLVPAIIAPAVRAISAAGRLTLITDAGPVAIRVAGTLASTPAFPDGGAFVVVPLRALRTPGGVLLPSEILLTGPRLDQAQLASVVGRVLPGATITLRSAVLRALADAPLQHGAYMLFAAGIGAAAGLSAVILLLALALGAQEREVTLTRLGTMGLGARQARLTAAAEALPALVAAAVAGDGGAALLAALIGPALDLSIFTGSAARVPVHADLAALAWPALGLAVLGLLTLAAEVTAARRRGLAHALRIGG
jgi:putative ABC transport system permease protein